MGSANNQKATHLVSRDLLSSCYFILRLDFFL